ncbi:nucleotide-sugar transporter-domain-containing protein [Paraphoma chrysanthemicola]|uniref:DNA 3'-5' helicase n=1 Tax=Paraphoma chrysanthemicola TaxID=798071 RepID=A0A8K0RF62_9PLEO|nr:nucleotide-sugar transporter-domain-containing protein [Paraphoma chrysanthemicola]
MARTASATLGGVSMKHLSLATLTFQNSALILIMHYSRVMPLVDGQRYHTSTSVFLNEVIKLGISLTMALYEMSQTLPANTTLATLFSTLATAIVSNESWKLGIPAILYTIQNTLQYVAVSNLDAATFQVTYQLKILTTAIFSVLMLGRSLSARKWLSLLFLIIGVSIIQVPQHTAAPVTPDSKTWPSTFEELRKLGSVAAHKLVRSATYEGIDADSSVKESHMNSRVGLLAVMVACALSGLAGVTFEKILKDSHTAKNTTLWVRNCQLSFWSLFPSLFLGVFWNEGAAIAKTGFFAGYNWVVWLAILFQAAGGVIVALVINYADNIAKNFATSVSIVLSCIASAYFFDFKVTPSFFIGTCVVLFATYLYTKPERAAAQSPLRIASLEKTSRQVAPTAPNRDRFRAMQYQHAAYDEVEDDDLPEDDGRMQFDSFDDRVLQQPYPARKQKAEKGTARLSLAPGPSTYFSTAAPSLSQRPSRTYQPSMYDETDEQHDRWGGHDAGRMLARHEGLLDPTIRNQLSRFAYNANLPEESSSDVQLGPSSSPALKAGQRRAEHSLIPLTHDDTRYGPSGGGGHNLRQYQHATARQLYERFATPEQRFPQDDWDEQAKSYHAIPQQAPDRAAQPQPKAMNLLYALPVCQGIQLVPVSVLPDRLRTVFPYPTFNAVQSKCFDSVFRSDNNFVLASPTGSGKTIILELAICRAIATNATGQYKIIYQAPTKALCAERQRDWAAKFTPIGLKCAELTGDSDASDVRNVQGANIIITTPEKWDSITRKWKDHEKLMRLIKVFLIDEVHILKEDRGAVLEAVVSRMKSIGTDVRFVALSATVPNFQDVAAWLGRNPLLPAEPAINEKFGEEFRPVKLRKHVCGYVCHTSNDFGFEKVLDTKLPEVIAKYSEGKPIMIFCATRASCLKTARLIATWWMSRHGQDRKWNPPTKHLSFANKDLRDTTASGVAFHHAGLDFDDRAQVENGFLCGDINVICCTSTLAVGVNLPCHLVIVKNTVSYTNDGMQEYSDLEMMQMLGRAGRLQFDDTAVAVIMTRQTKVRRYETMVTGQDLLESKLHLNLIDHMNAEIGLGTIRDLASARKWLTGTFLYVRLQQNPGHYKLEGSNNGQNVEELVDDICFRDIAQLREHNLVSGEEHFQCTEFGYAMARYYVHFGTMKVLMGIQAKATPSEILSAIAQASDFDQLRFRSGEKSLYKILNKSPSIRFAIPVNLDLPAHKVSLIIQAILGAADISWDGENAKHKQQFATEAAMVFKNISSLIRCIIDCQIYLGDSISIHSALMLERSLGSRIWDDSPLQMKQIDGIGPVAVRKLVNAGVRSMEDLEACDAHRIETLVGRNPPFGMKVLELAKGFPKLRVSLHAQPSSITKCPDGVKIQVRADIGFINEKPPQRFAGKLVYVCLLAETSDGRKIHFARISGTKLGSGQNLVFPALLTRANQAINCYVMCDSVAGSLRGATVKPQIAPSMFPAPKYPEIDPPQQSNTSRRRAEPAKPMRKRSTTSEDFGDDGIDDDALVTASFGDLDFEHIENFANPTDAVVGKNTAKNKLGQLKSQPMSTQVEMNEVNDAADEPVQLANGKWACNHQCKNKHGCKHFCCKEGMDKPPKKAAKAKRRPSGEEDNHVMPVTASQRPKQTQIKLQLTASKRKTSSAVEELDLSQQEKKKKADYANNGPQDFRDLSRLHESVQKNDPPANLLTLMHKKPAYCYSQGGDHHLSFMPQCTARRSDASSDYGDIPIEELSSHFDPPAAEHEEYPGMNENHNVERPDQHHFDKPLASRGSDTFGDDDSLLGDAMIGLVDSQKLQAMNKTSDAHIDPSDQNFDIDYEAFADEEFGADMDMADAGIMDDNDKHGQPRIVSPPPPEKTKARISDFSITSKPFLSISQPRAPAKPRTNDFKPAKSLLNPINPVHPNAIQPSKQINNRKPSSTHPTAVVPNQDFPTTDVELLDLIDAFDDDDSLGVPATHESKKMDEEEVDHVPEAYKDLDPWLFKEFGDIVELVE